MHPETWFAENIYEDIAPNGFITSAYLFRLFIMSTHIPLPITYKGKNFLVPLLQQRLRSAGVPVVTSAPGIQIAADGIHWRVVSHDAVEVLFQRLSEDAKSTSSFTHNAPANLWAWRLNTAWTAHFPTCIPCKKICLDSHLTCPSHQARMQGLCLQMKFPSREQYCWKGVKFLQITTAHPEGELITREWLPADHPLPDKPPTADQYRRSSRPTIVGIQILSLSAL